MLKPNLKSILMGILGWAIALLVSVLALTGGLPSPMGQSAQAQTPAQPRGPITSVSQLTDVEPTDPYFEALQGLVERYGCVSGFPDGTFRASQPATRGEVAIVTYSCLQKMAELIQSGAIQPGSMQPGP